MDYSFFPGHGYPYMTGAAPQQGSYGEESRQNSEIGTHQDLFDPTAIFQTPYDAFRFEPLITTPPDLSDLPITLPGTEEATPVPSSGLLDNGDYPKLDLNPRQGDRRSSSEEKELTPALSRRKAQNRAAQRAFRERKERHVKDLEAKLSQLESSATTLASDNQRLKLALQRAMTENEILRATTGTRPPATSLSAMRGFSAPDSPESDDDVDDAGGAVGGSGDDGDARGSGERVGKKEALGPGSAAIMLSSYALWDYIVEHPLVRSGQIDISDACDRLRRLAKPGRNGPVFPEEEVKRAIEGSRRGGGDALI